MAEFAYNNKVHAGTKVLPFKANSRQDPRMGFEMRKKGKHEGAEKFAKRMKNMQEKAKAALQKAQEEMKRYANRERGKVEKYRVGNLVLLSTKDLKYQMAGRRTEKFTECFVGPYKVKVIISSNAIELELPRAVKIHPVVNVSRVQRYKSQVEGQRKEAPQLVVIEGEEGWEVEKIMNKRRVQGRDKYLVQWNGCTAEEDTWENKENLKNAMELVEEFERNYSREEEEVVRWQEAKEDKKVFNRELPGRYTAKLLYGWGNKKYNQEYWKRMEENWRQWKRNLFSRYNRNLFLKRMEEEKNKYEGGKIEEWNEEDEEDRQRIEKDRKYLENLGDENLDMGDLRNPYDEL